MHTRTNLVRVSASTITLGLKIASVKLINMLIIVQISDWTGMSEDLIIWFRQNGVDEGNLEGNVTVRTILYEMCINTSSDLFDAVKVRYFIFVKA